MPLTMVKPEDLASFVGKSLEPSSWLLIDQDRINAFADATNDHQFIHVACLWSGCKLFVQKIFA